MRAMTASDFIPSRKIPLAQLGRAEKAIEQVSDGRKSLLRRFPFRFHNFAEATKTSLKRESERITKFKYILVNGSARGLFRLGESLSALMRKGKFVAREKKANSAALN